MHNLSPSALDVIDRVSEEIIQKENAKGRQSLTPPEVIVSDLLDLQSGVNNGGWVVVLTGGWRIDLSSLSKTLAGQSLDVVHAIYSRAVALYASGDIDELSSLNAQFYENSHLVDRAVMNAILMGNLDQDAEHGILTNEIARIEGHEKSAQQVDAPEPATNADPASRSPSAPAR